MAKKFNLIPIDITSEHAALMESVVTGLLEYHKQYNRRSLASMDTSVGPASIRMLVHFNIGLDKAGLKLVKKKT